MPTTNPDPDPKAAGLGAEALSPLELMMKSHAALRDVLRALEALTPRSDADHAAFDEFRSKAQAARRVLEDVDAELASARNNGLGATALATGPSNGSGSDVHIHVHLTR